MREHTKVDKAEKYRLLDGLAQTTGRAKNHAVERRSRLAPYSRVIDGTPQFSLPGSEKERVPVVTYGPTAFMGRVTDRIRDGRTTFLQPVAQSSLSAAVCALVRAGIGLGWLPGVLAHGSGEETGICEVGDGDWATELEIRLYRGPHTTSSRFVQQIWDRVSDLAT